MDYIKCICPYCQLEERLEISCVGDFICQNPECGGASESYDILEQYVGLTILITQDEFGNLTVTERK